MGVPGLVARVRRTVRRSVLCVRAVPALSQVDRGTGLAEWRQEAASAPAADVAGLAQGGPATTA